MEIEVLVPTIVKVRVPDHLKTSVGNIDEHACLIDEEEFTYDCAGIECDECYFSLSVANAVAKM